MKKQVLTLVAFATAILCLAFVLNGCTSMTMENPDGSRFTTTGAWLLSRQDAFVYTVTANSDATSDTLHSGTEYYLERQTDENASGQVRLMEKAFEMGLKAGTAGVAQ